MKFPSAVSSKINYYIYLYIHPDTDKIFYVGRGVKNRVFSHLADTSESEKTQIIKELREDGKEPKIEILIHGLPDKPTASKVEAAVIDLIGMGNLSNKARGWGAGVYGRMPYQDLIAMYTHEQAEIAAPSILFRINKFYRYGMQPIELYDVTRGRWRIGKDRDKAELAFTVHEGIIKEVYEIKGWYPAGTTFSTRTDEVSEDRWEFVGNIASKTTREKYINKSVTHYFKKGEMNPIKYVNIKDS